MYAVLGGKFCHSQTVSHSGPGESQVVKSAKVLLEVLNKLKKGRIVHSMWGVAESLLSIYTLLLSQVLKLESSWIHGPTEGA
jgi:hypothetical protein